MRESVVNPIQHLSATKQALFSRLLEEKTRKRAAQLRIPVRKAASEAPLSFVQEQFWFLDQLSPHDPAYNVPNAVRIIGPLRVEILEKACNGIVERHQLLRTTFAPTDQGPAQTIHPSLSIIVPQIDLSALTETERAVEEMRLQSDDAMRPFDLLKGPLLRLMLLKLSKGDHIACYNMHHIITDGASLKIFQREIAVLYDAFDSGASVALPPLPVQYADFAAWQQNLNDGDVRKTEIAYWKQQLAGAERALELPSDRFCESDGSFEGTAAAITIPSKVSAKIKDLARAEKATVFMTLLAAFKVLLHRYTGQQDIVVGTIVANRINADTESLIGPFLNTVALRSTVSGNLTFEEYLRKVRQVCLDAYAHQNVSF